MPLLSNNDVKAELSYAYLHAVAARAGFGCECAGRHTDSAGVDAMIRIKDRLDPDSSLTEFTLEIQLKATSQQLVHNNSAFSFPIRTAHYDKLRGTDIASPRYLAVLMMPENDAEWLHSNAEELICRRCVRWVSLRNAPEVTQGSITVYVPEQNVLNPAALRELARKASKIEWIDYVS